MFIYKALVKFSDNNLFDVVGASWVPSLVVKWWWIRTMLYVYLVNQTINQTMI